MTKAFSKKFIDLLGPIELNLEFAQKWSTYLANSNKLFVEVCSTRQYEKKVLNIFFFERIAIFWAKRVPSTS